MGEEASAEDLDASGGGGDGDGDGENENAFLRTVAITMNCSTPSATLRYTTDGHSVPGPDSPSVSPGTAVQWSEEGATEFRVIAVADGLYQSELTKWPVTVVAPRIDEYPVAESASSSSSSSSLSSSSRGKRASQKDLLKNKEGFLPPPVLHACTRRAAAARRKTRLHSVP